MHAGLILVLILEGNTAHVAHMKRKTGLFINDQNFFYSWSKKILQTYQITDFTPHLRKYFWVTILHKHLGPMTMKMQPYHVKQMAFSPLHFLFKTFLIKNNIEKIYFQFYLLLIMLHFLILLYFGLENKYRLQKYLYF